MHQGRFRLGLRPDPAKGAYSAPPDPLAGFKGVLLLRGGEGRRRSTCLPPLFDNPGYGPVKFVFIKLTFPCQNRPR